MTMSMIALDFKGWRHAQHSPERLPELAQKLNALAIATEVSARGTLRGFGAAEFVINGGYEARVARADI